jgi:hypothetical protein
VLAFSCLIAFTREDTWEEIMFDDLHVELLPERTVMTVMTPHGNHGKHNGISVGNGGNGGNVGGGGGGGTFGGGGGGGGAALIATNTHGPLETGPGDLIVSGGAGGNGSFTVS